MRGDRIAEESPSRQRRVAWFVCYLLLALITHSHVLYHAMQCDNSLFLRYARDWKAGALPYLDRYEPKTPVVFWLFRAIDSSRPRSSFYLAAAGLIALAAFELRRALAGPVPQSAPVVPILLIAWTGLGYQHLYDAFVIPFAVLTIAWLGRAVWVRSVCRYPVVTGLAFVVMAGLFPPAGLCGVAYLPLLVWNVRRNGWAVATGGVIGFLVGVAIGAGLVVAHAVWGGYWDGFLDAMDATRRYAAVNRVTAAEHLDRWRVEMTMFLREGGQLLGFAVVVSSLAIVLRWRSLSSEARIWAVAAVLWLAAAQAATFPGGRHFSHYYFPMLAPLALIGSLGLAAFPNSAEFRRASGVLVAALIVTAVGYHLLTDYKTIVSSNRRESSNERTAIRHAVGYLKHNIPPEQSVLICTWGRWAELYWQFHRPGPSRHVVPFNLAETRPEFFAEWADDVLANPPDWVLTDNTLLGPGVSDEVIRSRAGTFGGAAMNGTPAFDQVRAMVRDEYVEVIRAEDLIILRRKSAR